MRSAGVLAATVGLVGVLVAGVLVSYTAPGEDGAQGVAVESQGGADGLLLTVEGGDDESPGQVDESPGYTDDSPFNMPDVEPPEMFDPPTDAELRDLEFFAERDAISLEEAVAIYGWRRGFGQLVQEIAAWHRKSFAGAAVEQDGSIWIAFKEDVPTEVVALVGQFEREVLESWASSARIELVPNRGFSARELNARVIAAYRAAYQQSPLVSEVSTEADPRTGEILMVVRPVSQDLARTLADVRSRVPDDVTVRATFLASGGGEELTGAVSAVVHEVRVNGELALEVILDTCNADVSVDVEEYDDRAVIHATQHDWYRFLIFRNACQDLVPVNLERPLGDRRVTNSSGDEIAVIGH